MRFISRSSRAEERRTLAASPSIAVDAAWNGGRRFAQVWVRRGTLRGSQALRKASLRSTMEETNAPAVKSVENASVRRIWDHKESRTAPSW